MESETVNTELTKLYKVLVCAGELLFTGMFRCNISQRLIDALNEGVRESRQSTSFDFLTLQDVTQTQPTGETKNFPRIFIAKNNIIFIAQISVDAQELKLNAYPYRKKQPVGVTIYAAQLYMTQVYASHYVLTGQLFAETWGHVSDTIETQDRFLPLTKVEVAPPLPDGEKKFDFIAINRERIISICEDIE